jgi:hypothetical protein
MYHGTSSTNLRSILKQGVVPNPKDRVWAKDTDINAHNLSRESLSGSYWTSNLMTAESSATTATRYRGAGKEGENIIVMALISEGSAFADEDNINQAILIGIEHMYQELFGGGIILEALPKIAAYLYWGGYEGRDYSEKMTDSYSEYVHGELASDSKKQPIPRELLKDVFEAMMFRGLAYEVEHSGSGYYRDQYVKEMERLASEGKAPEIPPLAEVEQRLLKLRDALTRVYTKTAYFNDQFAHTLRTEEPVTYRGANRIVCIMIHPHDYKQPRTLVYGQIPDDYREQYRQRMGQSKGIVDTQGNVVEPPEQEPEPQQVAASVGGNEGEINEEPPQTTPPEQDKDKIPLGGNAASDGGHSDGWDWTNPIHGSGHTNAVVSSTP